MEVMENIKTMKFRPEFGMWVHRGLLALGIVAVLGTVVGGAYSLAYWRKILPGVRVAEVEVGNMSGEVAADLIQEEANKRLVGIKVKSGERSWDFLPNELGVEIDLPATINKAWEIGRSGGVLE